MKKRLLIAAVISLGITLLALALTCAWENPSAREIQLWQQATAFQQQATDDLYFTNRPVWQQLDNQRYQRKQEAEARSAARRDAQRGTGWIFSWAWKFTALFLIVGLIWPPKPKADSPTMPS
jgi:hypothetical protein